MEAGTIVLRRPFRTILIAGLVTLVALTLNPVAFVGAGPEEVVLVDIVELRRFYRSNYEVRDSFAGGELFSDDGGPDLLASIDYLEARGVSALEVYPSFILARINGGTKSYLETLGIRVESIPQRSVLPLGPYAFDNRAGEPAIPLPFQADPPVGRERQDYIVQFLGPQKVAWGEKVAEVGESKAILGRFAAVIEMTAAGANTVRLLPFVEWVGLFHPAYKIAPPLMEAEGTVRLDIWAFEGRDPSEARQFVEASGGNVLEEWDKGIRVEFDLAELPGLARLPSVSSVASPPHWVSFNAETTAILQSGYTGSRPIFARGLHGQGQLLTVADNGINTATLHEALDDPSNPIGPQHRKIEAYEAFNNKPLGDQNGHGTPVIATAAGDAPPYGVYNLYDGHAFAARLYIQDIGDIDGSDPGAAIGQMLGVARSKGSWIHSNSYGSYISEPPICISGYAGEAQTLDDFLDDSVNENFVILYGVGNNGDITGQCISNQAHSKNAIIIGAMNGTGDVATFSSRGLTQDGRISPTVVAPGVCVITARRDPAIAPEEPGCVVINSKYYERSGTSWSTPAVAGSVALIRQYLVEGWYPTGYRVVGHEVTPSGALLKALLVNSGV